ncbi:winged helix-turn-helix transcriptional regulator [Candidatus Sumerlaeota bacterium]|nr:winged helix-turn-helix transcriptional regulator [Candidatus Sumerlaeota bacterium]
MQKSKLKKTELFDWDVLRYKAEALKALAHPTRLAILEILLNGERCVCELMDALNQEQATVSKHLQVLKSAGLLHSYKKGMKIYYSLCCSSVADMLYNISTSLKEIAAKRRCLLRKIK